MDTLVVALQIALAAVLVVAAVGKLLDLPGSRQAVRDFGAPARYAPLLGTVLPVAELLLALGLLFPATARWAALGATLLFLVFIAAIGWNLRQGRQPDCHCFGQVHSEPAGPSTLIRNAVLAIGALIVTWNGGRSIAGWIRDLSNGATIALVFALLVLALGVGQVWLMRQLLGQNARILDRLDRLGGGEPEAAEAEAAAAGQTQHSQPDLPFAAPAFDLPTPDGERLMLAGLLARGKPVLLLFVDPGCGPCTALVPDMAEWDRRFGDEVTVAWLSWGSVEANREKFGAHGMTRIGLQSEREVYQAYGVRGTPSGVLVHPDGMVREAYATGRDRIRELIAWVVREDRAASTGGTTTEPIYRERSGAPEEYLRVAEGPAVGAQGSRVPLPTLDGGFASIDDYLGREAIVLFIGAQCEFTRRMLPELKEWEDEAGEVTSRVLAVSMGSVEENRELGLRSRIAIDDGFTLAESFGATGTPAAILLDAEGRVASPLASGNDAVLDLLWEQIDPVEGGVLEGDHQAGHVPPT